MPYCTLDDLKGQISEQVLLELTDDQETGSINLNTVNTAITKASSKIDSYCQSRYPVPFNPIPEVIKDITVDIALYNLFSRKGINEEGADKIIVVRYKDAIRYLENLAKGLVTLGQPQPPPQNDISITSSPRVFSRDKLGGF